MEITVYFKRGDMSNPRGMILGNISYDDRFFGKPDIYGEEITKEEYDELTNVIKSSGAKRGFEGYVNDEGYAKYLEFINNAGE